MWLVAVVGRCVVGCEHCEGYCSNINLHSARSVDNKHLTVASCWFSLSLHNLLTLHGHRNLKKILSYVLCFPYPINAITDKVTHSG